MVQLFANGVRRNVQARQSRHVAQIGWKETKLVGADAQSVKKIQLADLVGNLFDLIVRAGELLQQSAVAQLRGDDLELIERAIKLL